MDPNEVAAAAQEPQQEQRRARNDHDDVPVQEHPPPTFEAEISQLTSSLTSWWGSVTKQSQATLDQARTHIQKQGGILNAAKSEWSKLEEHLNDAQKRARDAAFADEDGGVGGDAERKGSGGPGPLAAPSEDDMLEGTAQPSAATAAAAATGDKKGKARARSAAPEEAGQGEATAGAAPRSTDDVPQMISADGTTIFDSALPLGRSAGGGHNRGQASLDLNAVAKEAQVQATQFANNASSFFSRIGSQIASDPRVANLQKSLASSLSAGPTTGAEGGEHGEGAEKADGATAAGQTRSADGASPPASSNQAALPSWSTTQALARKYWAEAEAVARDVGRDVRELVNEVVQVVPPSDNPHATGSGSGSGGVTREGLQGEVDKIAKEREYAENNKRNAAAAAKAAASAPAVAGEEDEFDWDEDEEESKGKGKGKQAGSKAAATGAPAAGATDKAPAATPSAPSSTEPAAAATPATASLAAAAAAAVTAPTGGVPASASRDSNLGLETTTGPRTDRFSASSHSTAGDEDGDSDWE